MKAIPPTLFPLTPEQAVVLEPAELQAVQHLLERCDDYFLLVEGLHTWPQAAQEMMTDRPPDHKPEDKLMIGIYQQDKLIGLLEGMKRYPVQGMWWIGLLAVDPDYRNQGLGERIMRGFEVLAAKSGAWAIGIGVAEINEDAYRFWKRVGFELNEKTTPRRFGEREHCVYRMRKVIG